MTRRATAGQLWRQRHERAGPHPPASQQPRGADAQATAGSTPVGAATTTSEGRLRRPTSRQPAAACDQWAGCPTAGPPARRHEERTGRLRTSSAAAPTRQTTSTSPMSSPPSHSPSPSTPQPSTFASRERTTAEMVGCGQPAFSLQMSGGREGRRASRLRRHRTGAHAGEPRRSEPAHAPVTAPLGQPSFTDERGPSHYLPAQQGRARWR